MRFRDRRDAGRRLAPLLGAFRRDHPLVLGLPRGGVPVAAEVAAKLGAPLDVWVVRKIGAPGHSEFGIGAVAEGGAVHVDRSSARMVGADDAALAAAIEARSREVASRVALFRGGRSAPDVRGRSVIVVDDGIATGVTLRAVLADLRARQPANLVVAVPVADAGVARAFRALADEVIVVHETDRLGAVGNWYDDFSPTSDDEVLELLRAATRRGAEGGSAIRESEVRIELAQATLDGTLAVPDGAKALVLFAHGSGSSRLSPRNRRVAAALHARGLATLLFDLLTLHEAELDERHGALRFDIPFLATRLEAVTAWAARLAAVRGLPVGYFGASTGAAAALIATADQPGRIGAVVSRGGRPDLAGDRLGEVDAPTLLVVGGDDRGVLGLNRKAFAELRCAKQLEIVGGATHLFEEPGALDEVAALAGDWFERHLVGDDEAA